MSGTHYFISIGEACRMLGGDKPISKQTYYRLAARGVVPTPVKVAPNISRVPADALRAVLQAISSRSV